MGDLSFQFGCCWRRGCDEETYRITQGRSTEVNRNKGRTGGHNSKNFGVVKETADYKDCHGFLVWPQSSQKAQRIFASTSPFCEWSFAQSIKLYSKYPFDSFDYTQDRFAQGRISVFSFSAFHNSTTTLCWLKQKLSLPQAGPSKWSWTKSRGLGRIATTD